MIDFIAEIGVNHNGSADLARDLVLAAKKAGATVAKFQVFTASELVTRSAPSAGYQIRNTGAEESQFEMLERLQLSDVALQKVAQLCADLDIEFMASAFSLKDIERVARLNPTRLKIPSGELTNLPYLRAIASLGKTTILSTGMATMQEIREALTALESAGLDPEKVIILHCTTDYPTEPTDANLAAITSISHELGCEVGYSDHTSGIDVAPLAVALGARTIEKHLTLSQSMEGPDHKASLEPDQFGEMVSRCNQVLELMGDGHKQPTKSELPNREIVRKSIVASKPIRKGEAFAPQNITTKRPATGLSPMLWDSVIGKKARTDFETDQDICL